MAIKLIVTDMDETFLRANKTYDKEKADGIFKKIAEQNIVFGIASGNFVPLLESYFDEEILENIYLASDDGNVLKNSDEVLRTLPIEKEDARAVFSFMEDKEGYHPIFSTGEQAYVKGPLEEWAANEIAIYYGDFTLIHSFNEIPAEHDVVKIEMLCEHPLDDIKEIMKQIETQIPGVSSVTSGEEWLDVYHKDGGKGEAVKFLQEKYHISKEETMCFGDSLNDQSMMKEAYYSMAMENADDELKKDCRFQIGTNEDQSVLVVLEQLMNNDHLDFLEKYRK